jgi:hypothetical protein
MGKKKGFFLPAIAALVVLVVGFAMLIFLPPAEERAFTELLEIEIPSVRWNGITVGDAVADLNAEIQKRSNTRCRFFLADDARRDIRVDLELNQVLAIGCAEYLAQESGNSYYLTAQGCVIDGCGKESTYNKSSWRGDLRDWFQYDAPRYWRRLCGQTVPDPLPMNP